MLNARFPFPTRFTNFHYAPAKAHAAPLAPNLIVFAAAAAMSAGAGTLIWLNWVFALGH